MPSNDVIQEAVVALPYHWIEGVNAGVLLSHVVDQGVGRPPKAKRAGQHNRALYNSKLRYLQKPEGFPETVEYMDRAYYLVFKKVALVRLYHRHARAYRTTANIEWALAVDQGDVANGHVGDVS